MKEPILKPITIKYGPLAASFEKCRKQENYSKIVVHADIFLQISFLYFLGNEAKNSWWIFKKYYFRKLIQSDFAIFLRVEGFYS